MKLLTIAEIKQLRNKEPIESFSGTIETVYPQKTGAGQYGPWWLQNMVVSDPTGKVQVTWGGEDDLKSLQGQQRIFESELSEKHGYLGIKWDVRRVNGKTYEGIKLTESCKIIPLFNGQAESATTEESEHDPFDRSSRIERQHSQEMALRYFALNSKNVAPTTEQLRGMIDWFQRDVGHSPGPKNTPKEEQAEPEEEILWE